MPELRCFFDAGSGAMVWPGDGVDGVGPVEPEGLPISRWLRVALAELVRRYDARVNWAEPNCPWFWREAECGPFNADVRRTVECLRAELGPEWTVTDLCAEVHEDPDLDAYLADPVHYRP